MLLPEEGRVYSRKNCVFQTIWAAATSGPPVPLISRAPMLAVRSWIQMQPVATLGSLPAHAIVTCLPFSALSPGICYKRLRASLCLQTSITSKPPALTSLKVPVEKLQPTGPIMHTGVTVTFQVSRSLPGISWPNYSGSRPRIVFQGPSRVTRWASPPFREWVGGFLSESLLTSCSS